MCDSHDCPECEDRFLRAMSIKELGRRMVKVRQFYASNPELGRDLKPLLGYFSEALRFLAVHKVTR